MRLTILAGAAGLAVLAACSDGMDVPTGRVQVGVATEASAAAATPGGALFADTYNDSAGNTLVIDGVTVVVRKLHLEGSTVFGCEDEPDTTGTPADSVEDEDACGVVRGGPILVDLPLNGGVEHEFTVTVDTGTYRAILFQIHKPEGSADAAFLAEHPEYDGVSIRVSGTFNGAPFVYTTGFTDVQRVAIDPPLVVPEGTVSFTLSLDLSGWFRGPTGGLIDPSTAMGLGGNAIMVQQNVVRSLHGFGDEDHNGQPDE